MTFQTVKHFPSPTHHDISVSASIPTIFSKIFAIYTNINVSLFRATMYTHNYKHATHTHCNCINCHLSNIYIAGHIAF